MVANSSHFGALRKDIVEMAAPPRGIITAALTADSGPIQDGFDPLTDTTGRFRLGGSDGLDDIEHFGCVDHIYR